MITTTAPALDPLVVNLVLSGLLQRDITLEDLAARVDLELDQLLDLIDLPPMQAKIQRLQRILEQRAALLATAAESAAIASLTDLMEEARTAQARREQLLAQRNDASADGDTQEAKEAGEALAELDLRFKKLTEAARSARATLTHARSRLSPRSGRTPPKPTNDRGSASQTGSKADKQPARSGI